MKTAMINAVMDYLRSMLGGEATLLPLSANEKRKAGWAVNLYTLHRASLRGPPCILALGKGTVRISPVAVSKQLSQLEKALGLRVVYVPKTVGAHDMPRLAAAGVPFVVPGRCVFLPDMGIALKSAAPSSEVVREGFSVSAQLIALSYLLGKTPSELTFGKPSRRAATRARRWSTPCANSNTSGRANAWDKGAA